MIRHPLVNHQRIAKNNYGNKLQKLPSLKVLGFYNFRRNMLENTLLYEAQYNNMQMR